MSWLRNSIRIFHDRHERLKNYIHNGFRVPLPRYGQVLMGMVYFTIPVVGGWYVMQWAISKSHHSIGLHGEKLPNRAGLQGLGDKRVVVVEDAEHPEVQYEKVGAGGWGGGVHLAISDEETQRRNQEKLRKFLKREQKRNQLPQEETSQDD